MIMSPLIIRRYHNQLEGVYVHERTKGATHVDEAADGRDIPHPLAHDTVPASDRNMEHSHLQRMACGVVAACLMFKAHAQIPTPVSIVAWTSL